MAMWVSVDTELCTGHGRCYMLADEVFGEDERGHCRVEVEQVPKDLEEKARSAAANCPEQAIRVFESERRE